MISTGIMELSDEFIAAHGYGTPGHYALISFTDTGIGMSEDTQKKIFEPFFTTKAVGEGTGLGLSIAYGIVKSHKGFINVYSEPGQGTTFKILIPLLEEPLRTGKEAEAGPSRRRIGTETVLVAEDDVSVRKLTRIILESAGYRVIAAGDGEDAVAKFNDNRDALQLVILDMIMPKKSGREAYEAIRKIRPGIKVLFMSGYTMDIISKRELLADGMHCIFKPVSPKELLKKVREVLTQ